MKHFSTRFVIVWCIVPFLIAFLGFISFWQGRALGAYGDDSAGYIYLAGRLFHHQPLMFVSDLGKQAIDFFQDEKLARWAIPTHHQYINPSGMAASKYPLLLSVLMYIGGAIIDSPRGFFMVQPLSGVGILVGTYVFVLLFFSTYRFRLPLALGSVIALYAAPLFFEATLAQPMRELPALCFLLWSWIALIGAVRAKRLWQRNMFASLSGVLFGFAVDIRETIIVVAPAILLYYLTFRAKNSRAWQGAIIGFIAFCLACAPLIYTAVSISTHKVPFKKRDTSSLVVLPNIGHVQSFSIENIFNNQGKFRPGEGSLSVYVHHIETAVPVGLFIFFPLYGCFRLIQREWKKTLVLLLWALPILVVYALWINPYGRYILPLYPVIMIMATYGAMVIVTHDISRTFTSLRIKRAVQVCFVTGIVAYLFQPLSVQIASIDDISVRNDREFVRADVNAIFTLDALLERAPENALLFFTGKNQAGLSEVFDAYTGRMSVRFPVDQKYPTTIEQTQDFFVAHIFPEYTVYALVDDSTDADFYRWAEGRMIETVGTVPFTFQTNTRLIRIIP